VQESEYSTQKYPEVGGRSDCHPKESRVPRPRTLRNSAPTVSIDRPAAHVNTMKARREATDNLIDNLHRTLTEQFPGNLHTSRNTAGTVLSGAKTKRVGRTPYKASARPAKHSCKAKSTDCVQITRSISGIEKLFSLSEELGIDLSKAGREVFAARGALHRGRSARAKRHIAKAKREFRDAFVIKFPSLLKDVRSSLKELESVGASAGTSSRLAGEAKLAFGNGDYEISLKLLRDAHREIHDSESEVMLRIMMNFKGKFVKAKKAGLDIDEAVQLVNRSRDMLRQGKFKEAVRIARESDRMVSSLLEQHREARFPLLECMKAVKLAEAVGADPGELNGMLAEARRFFKQNDLERSSKYSRRLIDLAKAAAYSKVAESYELAERSLLLAKGAGVEAADAQQKLDRAREHLHGDELAKSASMSSASMLESNSALVQALADKMREIGEFSKGIEGEIESLSEVREAIETSRSRDLENLKEYSMRAEEIVGQAYESAASYTRVSQDIVKDAYQNSIVASPPRRSRTRACRPAQP
jgi:hypothetical protein